MISEQNGQLFVTGAMNQQTASDLLSDGEVLMKQADRVLNLSGITAIDSSAVAVLLGWIRAARSAGRKLSVIDAPEAFVSLAGLYGLTSLLFSEFKPEGSETSVQH